MSHDLITNSLPRRPPRHRPLRHRPPSRRNRPNLLRLCPPQSLVPRHPLPLPFPRRSRRFRRLLRRLLPHHRANRQLLIMEQRRRARPTNTWFVAWECGAHYDCETRAEVGGLGV